MRQRINTNTKSGVALLVLGSVLGGCSSKETEPQTTGIAPLYFSSTVLDHVVAKDVNQDKKYDGIKKVDGCSSPIWLYAASEIQNDPYVCAGKTQVLDTTASNLMGEIKKSIERFDAYIAHR